MLKFNLFKLLLLTGSFVASLVPQTSFGDFTSSVENCTKCHSPSLAAFPRLEGQTSEYLFASTKAYITKERHSGQAVGMMFNRVKSLNDAAIKDLAAYFSALPAPKPASGGDPKLIAIGQEIYLSKLTGDNSKSCADCHGINGEGRGADNNGLNARLAGQTPNFIATQLSNYKSDLIDNQKVMHDMAMKLNNDQIKALAEFLASK